MSGAIYGTTNPYSDLLEDTVVENDDLNNIKDDFNRINMLSNNNYLFCRILNSCDTIETDIRDNYSGPVTDG